MNRCIFILSGLDLWNYGPRWEVFSRLAKGGYDIHYISPFGYDGKCGSIIKHKVMVPFFKKLEGRILIWFLFMFLSLKEALHVLKEQRPDIIYGYEIYGSLPAFILSKLLRVPLVFRFQGTILYPHLGKCSIFPHLLHVLAFKLPADTLIITNDGTRGDIVAKCLKVPREKILFWFNGLTKFPKETISPPDFKKKMSIPKSAKVVMSVCRLVAWKRVNRLIEAIPCILKKRKDIFFVIVGEGPEKKQLINLTKKLGVANNVIFTGNVSHKDIPSFLSIADVYVTLQDLSCLSASLMDAMISGRCIIALDTGDTYTVIKDGVTGILLEHNKLNSLSDVVEQLLKNDELRNQMGINAKEFAEKKFWTWNERAKAEIELISNLINSRD